MLNPIVVSQTAGVISDLSDLSNSSNPVTMVATGVATLVDLCSPPQIKYPARCLGLFITAGVAIASPEPFSKVAFLASLRSLLRP